MDPEIVKNKINERFERILHHTPGGHVKPYVCLVCDEFLKPNEAHTLSLEELEVVQNILTPSTWNAVAGPIARKYEYVGDVGDCDDYEEIREWIANMLLSPRGCYVRKGPGRCKEGFAVCSQCQMSLGRR